MSETVRLFQPSNGTQGMDFMARWCERCAKYRNGRCGILGRSMLYEPGDAKYPVEWRYVDGKPACTAFTEPGPEQPRTVRPYKGQREMFG